jgi:hypothetical protein
VCPAENNAESEGVRLKASGDLNAYDP